MQPPADPHEQPSPWPSALQGSIATVLLALASMGSQFDRTVINLMVGPLKATFSLDDTHFGMLQGVAFGIFYVVACVPIGRLADRYQRRLIIAAGIGLFSLFAMGSGLARSYLQLFLTRIGVAVGEASLTPAGLSMLSDLYSPDRLSRPISAFLMSAPVGQGLAFMAGGSLLHFLTTSAALTLGPLGSLAPWQSAFIIVGAPVLLLVPLFLLQREPARRGPGGVSPLTVAEVIEVLRSRARAIVPMFAGFAMVNLVSYTLFIWTPAFMQRSYGWNTAQIGMAFGLVILVCGTGGVFFAGWLSDRLTHAGRPDAQLRVAAFGFVGCGVFGALAPLMPNAHLALAMLAPAIFLSMMPYPCAGTAIQLIVPNRARGQVTALYVTMTTLVGLVVGPLVVGLMTDHVFHDPAQIRYSLSIVVGVAAPLMFVLLLTAFAPYRALRAGGLSRAPHPPL
jgi:MFS family permease